MIAPNTSQKASRAVQPGQLHRFLGMPTISFNTPKTTPAPACRNTNRGVESRSASLFPDGVSATGKPCESFGTGATMGFFVCHGNPYLPRWRRSG